MFLEKGLTLRDDILTLEQETKQVKDTVAYHYMSARVIGRKAATERYLIDMIDQEYTVQEDISLWSLHRPR